MLGAWLTLVCLCAGAQAASGSPELTKIEQLGKLLFEDTNLSRPAGVACASCHDPAKAFQGNNSSSIPALARGAVEGRFGARKPPSLAYASFSPSFGFIDKTDEETGKTEKIPAGGQFSDGRAADMLQQVAGPLLDPNEMNNISKADIVAKVRAAAYAPLARDAYGEEIFTRDDAFEKLAQAIVAYENTDAFHPFASRFDEYLRGREQLSDLEQKGFALFKDAKKGNCLACHAGKEESRDPRDWLFTDFTYDAVGAPRNPALPANADPAHFDLGLCARKDLAQIAPEGTDIHGFCGAFKAPTLRNAAIDGPYLHNGVFASLRDVVAFYATRDTNPGRWFKSEAKKFDDLPREFHANVNTKEVPYDRKKGETPRLDDAEIDAIVAFLKTLTDKPFLAKRQSNADPR